MNPKIVQSRVKVSLKYIHYLPTVQCTLYTVHCTVYSVYTELYALYSVYQTFVSQFIYDSVYTV